MTADRMLALEELDHTQGLVHRTVQAGNEQRLEVKRNHQRGLQLLAQRNSTREELANARDACSEGQQAHASMLAQGLQLREDLKTTESSIAQLEDELRLIEEKDSELRTYATLAPLSDDVKAQGVGGSAEKDILINEVDDSTIMLLKDRVDSLAFAINIQKDSYNTIFNKINSNETMYRHIPSISPVKGYIGSKYGYRTDPIDGKRRMHSGLDFPVNLNTDVVATGDGVVTKAQYDSVWGRYIKIDHGYGYETVYAHLWKINVKKGQKVKRGDKIGKSGNSGRAAGFHLHYEVHKNNKTVDPLKYFFTGYID